MLDSFQETRFWGAVPRLWGDTGPDKITLYYLPLLLHFKKFNVVKISTTR